MILGTGSLSEGKRLQRNAKKGMQTFALLALGVGLMGTGAEAAPRQSMPRPFKPAPRRTRTIENRGGLSLIGTIRVPTGPKSLRFSPDGRRVVVQCLYGHKVAVVDAATRRVVGFDLNEVAPGPDSEWDATVGMRLLYKMIGWALRSQGITH